MGTGMRRRGVWAAVIAAMTAAPAGAQEPQQPQWTVQPLFGETDVYVLPKGVSTFVFRLRPTTPMGGGPASIETAYRVEFGLPAHFQLGLHATGRTAGGQGVVGNIDAQTLEVRWAVAGWGRLWGNPTIHAEWREASRDADAATLKLLLGGRMGGGWRWGSNVAWTQEAGGARALERAWTLGVGHESGQFVSVGAETRLAFTDRLSPDGHGRTAVTRELLAGPSIQIRPVRRLFIDFAPLFGVTTASPRSRATLLAGWNF